MFMVAPPPVLQAGRIAVHRFAGFGATQFHDASSGRLFTKMVIEAHDTVHFGSRQVQGFGDQRHGGCRHATELVLHRMQNFQQRAGLEFRSGYSSVD
jgi:hypothetical protein